MAGQEEGIEAPASTVLSDVRCVAVLKGDTATDVQVSSSA